MRMRDGLTIEEPSGERWDLAVELLERGEGFVSFGPLILYRVAGGPRPDERLNADICSEYSSDPPTQERAAAEIAAGLRSLDVLLSDPRVAHIADQRGLVKRYVRDYGTGRSLLATIDDDGTVTWPDEPDRA
jgi:hypothetical protein